MAIEPITTPITIPKRRNMYTFVNARGLSAFIVIFIVVAPNTGCTILLSRLFRCLTSPLRPTLLIPTLLIPSPDYKRVAVLSRVMEARAAECTSAQYPSAQPSGSRLSRLLSFQRRNELHRISCPWFCPRGKSPSTCHCPVYCTVLRAESGDRRNRGVLHPSAAAPPST